jgi:hypothetical protein
MSASEVYWYETSSPTSFPSPDKKRAAAQKKRKKERWCCSGRPFIRTNQTPHATNKKKKEGRAPSGSAPILAGARVTTRSAWVHAAGIAHGSACNYFCKVLWTLNMLTWHCIDKERDDESFMGVERVSWGWNPTKTGLRACLISLAIRLIQ